MMSRKHYVIVAGIIKDSTIKANVHMLPTLNKINLITDLATMFKQDNNNFDADRFISACYDDDE